MKVVESSLFLMVLALQACAQDATTDPDPTDAETDAPVPGDLPMYAECSNDAECVTLTCAAISGTRQTKFCTTLCSTHTQCGVGACYRDPDANDDTNHCYQTCETSPECQEGFSCRKVGVNSSAGSYEDQICLPD